MLSVPYRLSASRAADHREHRFAVRAYAHDELRGALDEDRLEISFLLRSREDPR